MNIHIVEQPEFAAVFTLPSPARDHSGIGHLVEHLVFRTSHLFPERHNLFALTSLTQCKMNASTTGDTSYYFAQAQTSEDLLLLIEYLYTGLMTRTYKESDIEQEKSVIQHELAFYAKHPAYQTQSQIWRGDHHSCAYQHWGGFPDVLTHLTANDIDAYKSQYYVDHQLSIFASGILKEDIVTACNKGRLNHAKLSNHHNQPKIYQPKLTTNDTEDDMPVPVFSWWLAGKYQASVLRQFPKWQIQWPELYVEEELNHQGMFAIRYVGEKELSQFSTWLACQTVTAGSEMTKMTKFPESIQALLSSEISNTSQPRNLSSKSNAAMPISQLIDEPCISHLARLPITNIHTTQTLDLTSTTLATAAEPPTIIKRFTGAIAFELGSYQPKTIMQLLADIGDKEICIKADLWLIKFTPISLEKMTAIVQTSAFWAPRVRGLLYTMGVFELAGDIYVWGAGDIQPTTNTSYIQALIDSSQH